MALQSAEARPEQSDGYVRRIWARLQKTEKNLAAIAKILIGDNVKRVQLMERLERVERIVDMVTHDLAGVDDRVNNIATQLESLRAHLKLED